MITIRLHDTFSTHGTPFIFYTNVIIAVAANIKSLLVLSTLGNIYKEYNSFEVGQ